MLKPCLNFLTGHSQQLGPEEGGGGGSWFAQAGSGGELYCLLRSASSVSILMQLSTAIPAAHLTWQARFSALCSVLTNHLLQSFTLLPIAMLRKH